MLSGEPNAWITTVVNWPVPLGKWGFLSSNNDAQDYFLSHYLPLKDIVAAILRECKRMAGYPAHFEIEIGSSFPTNISRRRQNHYGFAVGVS